MEIALDDVDVPDGVEEAGPGRRLDLVERGATISARDRPATQPATFAAWYGDRTRSWTEPIVKS